MHAVPSVVDTSIPGSATPPNDLAGFAGIYGNYTAPLKAEWISGGVLMLHTWSKDGWQPTDGGTGHFTLRSDGWWWAEDGSLPNYRFEHVDAEDNGIPVRYRYLIMRAVPGFGYHYFTMPIGQLLSPLEPLSTAWTARLGTSWRITNDHPESIEELLENKPMALDTLPELLGYVLFGDAQLLIPFSDSRAGMSVKIPGNYGRDLHEIVITPAAGSDVLQIGNSLYAKV
ncbi:MAG: serine hydrolase, partial [Pigmentiphaga sp.]